MADDSTIDEPIQQPGDALQRIKHSLLFDKGLDTKTNPQLTDGYLQLQNCELFNLKLQKSKGIQKVTAIPNGDPANTTNVFESFNQLVVVADQEAYAYDPLDNILVDRGSFAYLQRTIALTAANNVVPLFYSEYCNYGCLLYQSNSTYFLRVQNLQSRITINIITFEFAFDSSEVPVGLILTSTGVFLYTQESGGNIDEYFYPYTSLISFPTTQAVLSSAQSVVPASGADASAYPGFKVISLEYDDNENYIWIFSVNSGGDAVYTVRNLYGATVFPVTTIPSVTPYTRELSGHNSQKANLNSFIVSGTTTIYAQFNSSIVVVNTASFGVENTISLPDPTNPYYSQSICFCGGIGTAGTLFVLKEDLQEYETQTNTFNSRVYPYVITYNIATSTWTITDSSHLSPPSNPEYSIYEWGNGFVVGALWPTLNNVYFVLMSIEYNFVRDSGNTVYTPVINRHGNYYITDYQYNLVDFAVHYLGSSHAFSVTAGSPPLTSIKTVPLSIIEAKPNRVTGSIPYTMLQNTQVEIAGGEISFDNQVYVYDVRQETPTKLANFDRGKTGYFGISNMYMLTQNNVEYAQFLEYPTVIVDVTQSGNIFYGYAVTYEYINANGELFRSAPSIFASVAFDIASVVPVVYFTLPSALEIKKNITIKVWRTTANSTTFYLLSSINFVPSSTPPFIADPPTPDSALVDNQIAYFNGGVLGEIPFDPFTTFTLFNNRFFAVTLDDSNIIQYSLPYQPTVGLATTFGFDFAVEPRGGDIIELAVIDEKLIIFKNDFIFYSVGDGADALGNNYSLSRPELINSPVGCISRASVVRIPAGIMFQSSKGIWLLDRSLKVEYIGAGVEEFNNLTVSSATLANRENKVRFTTEEGPILVYDFYYNTWTTDVGVTLLSTTVYQNAFYGIDTQSDLVQIYDGYYKKNQPYSMSIETPWVKLAGLQGFQRVYKAFLLGNFVNTHVLNLGIMFDFVEQVTYWLYFRKDVENTYGTNQWGSVIPFGGTEKSNYEIEFFMPRQKCQAIKFVISDGFDNIKTDNGNSFTLTEIMFLLGIKSDSMKLPASRRV